METKKNTVTATLPGIGPVEISRERAEQIVRLQRIIKKQREEIIVKMRKIKFRGQLVDTKEWIFGDLIQLERDFTKVVEILDWSKVDNKSKKDLTVISETVGQFTGLIDKNGVEIYEGDIITFDGITAYDKPIIGEIIFHSEKFQFMYGKSGAYSPLCRVTLPIPRVIGNKYDNPELL